MPIISQIGTRSWKVRLVYSLIYVVLLIGAVTMVYPFLLMLAGSVKSEADAFLITPYPEFWFKDEILFQKYVESKYQVNLDQCRYAWNRPVLSWRKIAAPEDTVSDSVLEDFRAWRASLSAERRRLGHLSGGRMLPKNGRLWRQYVAAEYQDDVVRFARETNQMLQNWSNCTPPSEDVGRYLNQSLSARESELLVAFKKSAPAEDTLVISPEGSYVRGYLTRLYTPEIAAYNKSHGTAYDSYTEVRLPERAPENPAERKDWEKYVREEIGLASVRLDPQLAPAWRAYLEKRHLTIATFNKTYGTQHADFAQVPFVTGIDQNPPLRVDWENFLKDRNACPLTAISLHTATHEFHDFVTGKRGQAPADLPDLGAIVAVADYRDCMATSRDLRWEFTTRNYKQVLDYIALHGHGIMNTLIYCTLAVITALVVNPLAAYALSRFKLPGTYKILLFCMATMAFPGEVTMIPAFILLKRFPLWPILGGIGATLLCFWLLEKGRPRWQENWRSLISLAVGLLIGGVAIPVLFPAARSVSLLNTFAALILPGMANGYFIFLLKGFFDSLPRELYEAAEIDGANEWTKFWMLTMYLSTPILAVIALGAFTGAYSAFMMALIIIPDKDMWTIMVWIFQLQSVSHSAVVYASLVIAALPTFLIFVVCQNVIMKGIVVPTEK